MILEYTRYFVSLHLCQDPARFSFIDLDHMQLNIMKIDKYDPGAFSYSRSYRDYIIMLFKDKTNSTRSADMYATLCFYKDEDTGYYGIDYCVYSQNILTYYDSL